MAKNKQKGPSVAQYPQPNKNPKAAKIPLLSKVPKSKDPDFADGLPLAWRFSTSDKSGSWAWSNLACSETHKQVIERLIEFEHQNLSQLRSTGSHPIPIGQLSKDARKRLADIGQDDLDELFSLRITGKQRIFCILDGNIMKILWWDPEHEVCPSNLKHT